MFIFALYKTQLHNINKCMNKKQNNETVIELGVLPELIRDGKAFEALMMVQENEHKQYVSKYRRMLYDKMTESLGVNAPRQSVSYRNWFTDPEKNVNKALLKNQRRNEHKWHLIVNAMHHSLSDVLMLAVNETEIQPAFYKERQQALSNALGTYLKQKN